ncbi:MAG: hypothetical protein IPG23_16680 [Burkholderiales bacterium]|nr:hypothetical protein [Burkholderiales bacterium]
MDKKICLYRKMKTQLDELNANMNKLEAKAEEAKDDARALYKGKNGQASPPVRSGKGQT